MIPWEVAVLALLALAMIPTGPGGWPHSSAQVDAVLREVYEPIIRDLMERAEGTP